LRSFGPLVHLREFWAEKKKEAKGKESFRAIGNFGGRAGFRA
jgi:hypothetical protein